MSSVRHMRQSQRVMRSVRGIILLVVLVAVVALAFAGMALVRAVATGVAISDNVNARQQAMFAASAALEHDVVTLFEDAAIDTTNDDPAHNYYASRQAGEDRRGVPGALLSAAAYPLAGSIIDAGGRFAVRHVIERLCLLPGDATLDNCTLSPPSIEAASGAPPAGESPRRPTYRVTMRVDGPNGVATFVQAMLSTAHANPRLSWQVLDE
jgi:type IV pilus assembly protein PilX